MFCSYFLKPGWVLMHSISFLVLVQNKKRTIIINICKDHDNFKLHELL